MGEGERQHRHRHHHRKTDKSSGLSSGAVSAGDRKLTSISHSALGNLKSSKIEKGIHSSKHTHRRADGVNYPG